MVDTARTIIRKAMQKLGILTKSEEPDADEAQDGLDMLNDLLDSWSNDSMLCYVRTWETFPLVANQATYQIGAGAPDFNTVRPIQIEAASIKLGLSNYPLTIIPDETYNNYIYDQTAPGMPEYLNLDNGYPIGKIRLWTVPNAAYNLFLLSEKPLTSFTNLTQQVIFPPGWKRALIYNLAIDLAAEYNQVPADALVKVAKDSKGAIQRAITSTRTLDAVPLAGNRQFDVISGQ